MKTYYSPQQYRPLLAPVCYCLSKSEENLFSEMSETKHFHLRTVYLTASSPNGFVNKRFRSTDAPI